ncbi:hypothetical protein ACMU_02320 [Actibacterium mucosum KCTC 23349]|uniref:Basal-body rod modification protein FlgD n=1 Tax=Actibacterium mucosum KCTC 23349 TaxID=1454373 RepID=A0A037ZP80_9RHOB|nr:flagellar hook capping FlgD N-terminal domain-containing protein [Actibacterium mucosum]KAJ57358.1 hypothetical protein ACMU_02320 [Actibacterium mucosum KCTC 23349]
MDIAAASSAAVQATNTDRPGNDPLVNSDFETFLVMLTTQLENQDPLNPVESADFAVQLATFSGVEQQVQTNDLLKSLAAQLGAGSVGQVANWVGKEVRAPTGVEFTGSPVTVVPKVNPLADAAQLVVVDRQGNQVQRLDITPGDEAYVWTGVGTDGFPLPDGTYTFHVDSLANGEPLGRTQAEVYGTVTEAQVNGDQVTLILSGGGKVAVEDVSALRDPG